MGEWAYVRTIARGQRFAVLRPESDDSVSPLLSPIMGEWAYVRTIARGQRFAVLRPESDDSVITIRYV